MVINWYVLVKIFRMRSLDSLLSFAAFFLPDAANDLYSLACFIHDRIMMHGTNLVPPDQSVSAHYASRPLQLVPSLSEEKQRSTSSSLGLITSRGDAKITYLRDVD
jgi:hypothetical protein